VSFFLCWPVLYTTAPIVQTARGVLVYICVSGPYGLYTAHRGPCIANYIPTLLGFEEYIGNYSPNIQQITPRLFPPNPNEHVLTKTLLLVWYIWKARNDQRFQRKTWSPLQVHAETQVFHLFACRRLAKWFKTLPNIIFVPLE
jgi:hypothetical protein